MLHIFVIDLKTIVDFINKEEEQYHESAKTFFCHMTLQNVMGNFISIVDDICFISKPIEDLLEKKMKLLLEKNPDIKNNIENKQELLALALAGTSPDPFELDMEHRESVFELAKLLNDRVDIEVIIISNDIKMRELKEKLIRLKSGDYNIKIIDTNRWVAVFYTPLLLKNKRFK